MCQNCTSAALAVEHERRRAEFTCWLIDHHRLCDYCQPSDSDPTPCSGSRTFTRAAGGVPEDEIIKWAVAIGLSVEAARRFVSVYGRLPNTYQEMAAWGTAHGYRSQDGTWTI